MPPFRAPENPAKKAPEDFMLPMESRVSLARRRRYRSVNRCLFGKPSVEDHKRWLESVLAEISTRTSFNDNWQIILPIHKKPSPHVADSAEYFLGRRKAPPPTPKKNFSRGRDDEPEDLDLSELSEVYDDLRFPDDGLKKETSDTVKNKD